MSILILLLLSLEYRESTPKAEYLKILKRIEETREERKAKESFELHDLLNKALKERNAR